MNLDTYCYCYFKIIKNFKFNEIILLITDQLIIHHCNRDFIKNNDSCIKILKIKNKGYGNG